MKTPDISQVKKQYQDFVSQVNTLIISSLSEDGKPFASYAPFVKHNGKFYIYISKIADHYRYIEASPNVDVLLIEDETRSANLFARQRVRFACHAVNLGNEGHEEIFRLFEERFGGKLMQLLRGLDFSLFELTVKEGRYVVGFGQAFDVDPDGERIAYVVADKEAR